MKIAGVKTIHDLSLGNVQHNGLPAYGPLAY
jgi:hypothetical protein